MAGAHKLGELLHRLHRCSVAVLDSATSLVCSLSKAYAQHQVTERVARSRRALRCSAGQVWRRAARLISSLLVHVLYFAAISGAGWGLLTALKVRAPRRRPRGIDMLFTAVSAATVSSMSAVEMEVFSNGQLLVLTALMFIGGEVFVSLVGLASKWLELRKQIIRNRSRVDSHDDVELETPTVAAAGAEAADADESRSIATTATEAEYITTVVDAKMLRRNAVRSLFCVVLAILLVVHVVGAVSVAAYMRAAPGARRTLRRKALDVWTFAVFTTVSTFSNCGYMPTNENMIVFKRDVPLQLLLAPQALVGNTLFPPLLAACVWATGRKDLAEVAKKGREATGYHLLEARRCWMLAGTVVGFIAVQAALVCAMEWGGALQGLSAGEKVSNALFLAVNSRHTGEATLDLSTLAPAVLVLFVLMM